MWNTTLGCRVLTDAERRLVCTAAFRLTDDIRTLMPQEGKHNELHMECGITLFDRLTPEQQIVMIDRVIGYLIDPDLDPPQPSALLDATVAALYAQAFGDIEVELDTQRLADAAEDGDTDHRKRVVAALLQPTDEIESEGPRIPDPECCDAETWEFWIDSLRGRVLADEDWLMDEVTLDLPPEESNDLKQKMGIDGDYFVDVPPDSTRADAREAWANLHYTIRGQRMALWRFGDQDVNPVMLSDVVNEMEGQPEDWYVYVNKTTGKVVSVPSDACDYFESGDDQEGEKYSGFADQEMLEEAWQVMHESHHVALPSKFDIHEWSIMRDFCDSRESSAERDELLAAIHGSGAFRCFKMTVDRLQLRDEWFCFRAEAFEAIAINWMEANQIAWLRDSELDRPLSDF